VTNGVEGARREGYTYHRVGIPNHPPPRHKRTDGERAPLRWSTYAYCIHPVRIGRQRAFRGFSASATCATTNERGEETTIVTGRARFGDDGRYLIGRSWTPLTSIYIAAGAEQKARYLFIGREYRAAVFTRFVFRLRRTFYDTLSPTVLYHVYVCQRRVTTVIIMPFGRSLEGTAEISPELTTKFVDTRVVVPVRSTIECVRGSFDIVVVVVVVVKDSIGLATPNGTAGPRDCCRRKRSQGHC